MIRSWFWWALVPAFALLAACGPSSGITFQGSSETSGESGTSTGGPETTFTDTPAVAGPVGRVQLDVGSGDVQVTVDPATTQPALTRRVTYRGQRPGATTSLDGGTLSLRHCDVDDCSVSYELRLPSAVPVAGDTGSGDLTLHGVGPVDVRAGSGTVTLDGVAGAVRVQVGSGDIQATGLAGEVHADSGSGDIEVALRDPESVTATAASGSVTLTVPRSAYTVDTSVGSGEAHSDVPSTPGAPHTLSARAASGDVEVRQN
jgi:hypothetical protein